MGKITLAVFIVCFISAQGIAQKIVYSSSIGINSFARYHIIGKVKNHIIIWNFNFGEFKHSYIMVYDNDLKLSAKVNTNILKTDRLYSIDFINNSDYFCVFYKYRENDDYLARLAWFDENGNCTGIKTVDSISLKTDEEEIFYPFGVIQSNALKTFALVKVVPVAPQNVISVEYNLYSDSIERSGEAKLPFDYDFSNINSFLLDRNKDLWLAKTENESNKSVVSVYKINTLTHGVTNTIRQLDSGHLMESSVNIFESKNKFLVYGEWISSTDSSRAQASLKGIFAWQLYPDLADISTDTVLEIKTATGSCLSGKNFFTLQVSGSGESEFSFLVGPAKLLNNFSYNGFYDSPYNPSPIDNSSPYSQPDVRSSGHSSFYVPVSNGIYTDPNYKSPDPFDNSPQYKNESKRSLPKDSGPPILVGNIISNILNINNENKILWTTCFNNTLSSHPDSINASFPVVGRKALHIIHSKTPINNTGNLENVTILPDGSFSSSQIISMNLKYQFDFGMARQVSNTAIILPCIKKDKLSFAKIEIE